jgi:DNA-binding transcriptional ArsR family regulator
VPEPPAPAGPPRPADETLEASSPAQLKALAHPLRQRLLYALGGQPATISQLAVSFGERKGNIAHHLKVLSGAGMVRIVETRQVRGGTEHYYQRTTTRVHVGGPPAASTTAMLRAVADELTATPKEPLLILRHVRLSPAQAERLAAALTAIVAETTDDGAGERSYGLLVGLYES